MKRPFFRLSPKQALILSAVLLVCSLYYLWTAAGYPMPTPELFLHKLESEAGLPHSAVVATVTPADIDPALISSPTGDLWLFSRRGDEVYAYSAERVGPLWGGFFRISLTERVSSNSWIIGQTDTYGLDSARRPRDLLTAVAVTDHTAARVTITQCIFPGPNDSGLTEAELMELYGSTTDCTETSPGSGVWLGRQTVAYPPFEFSGWTIGATTRAYDANGKLLYSTPD